MKPLGDVIGECNGSMNKPCIEINFRHHLMLLERITTHICVSRLVYSNAYLSQENIFLVFKKGLFVHSYGFVSLKILPLASLPQVANKVLLPDHKVDNASKGSWSCYKNGLITKVFLFKLYRILSKKVIVQVIFSRRGILLGLTLIIYASVP